MSTLIISGTIEQIERKLLAVKRVIDSRKPPNGYPLWSRHEIWQYSSAGDSRVCTICSGYEGTYTGDEVKRKFPNVEYLGNYTAHPRTHDNSEFPDAGYYSEGRRFAGGIYRREGATHGCGCMLTLLNPAEAFEAQLHEEKVVAV